MQNGNQLQKFGEPIASFSLPGLNGGNVTLASSLAGRKGGVVVVWSSTCSHCVRYDKYFNSFAQRHPELALLTLASRAGETAEAVRKAATHRNLRFTILVDSSGATARALFAHQTPRAFLVDAAGALHYRGAIDNYKFEEDPEYMAYLEPAITQFLAGQPVEKPETASYGCAVQSVYYKLPRVL